MRSCTVFSGVQSIAEVVRCGRLRWFGYVERNFVRVEMIGCQPVEMCQWQG